MSFVVAAWQREIVLSNEVTEALYVPYCMRRLGLLRVRKIEMHY